MDVTSGLARRLQEFSMEITKASVHFMTLENGERIKYLRLEYSSGGTIIGRSVLASRFRPEFVARVEAAQ